MADSNVAHDDHGDKIVVDHGNLSHAEKGSAISRFNTVAQTFLNRSDPKPAMQKMVTLQKKRKTGDLVDENDEFPLVDENAEMHLDDENAEMHLDDENAEMPLVNAIEFQITSHQAYIVNKLADGSHELETRLLRELCPPGTIKRLIICEFTGRAGLPGIHTLKSPGIVTTSENFFQGINFKTLLQLQKEAISDEDFIDKINVIQKEILQKYLENILPSLLDMLSSAGESVDPLIRELHNSVIDPLQKNKKIKYTPKDLRGLRADFAKIIPELYDVLNVFFCFIGC